MQTRPSISYIIMIGDSLSDRGTMYNRYLLGCIPLRKFAGLSGTSPQGSFTNGFPWSDYLAAELANSFTIKKLKKERHLDSSDIADGIINKDIRINFMVENYYNLKNDLSVEYKGINFFRTYDEGGLTSYDYSWMPSKSITRFFTRLIVTTLAKKRAMLLSYDKNHQLSAKQKDHTLIIEWSGANDLITVNERPSKLEADRAVTARIQNVTKLISQGYSHFLLFNLPDLSLTPRYQALSSAESANAKQWSKYFNVQLELACSKLRKDYPACTIDLFDADQEFSDLYEHPERYGMDPAKKNKTYIDSPEFKMNPDNTSPSKGFIWWNEVHPTADVHTHLANKVCAIYEERFNFIAPSERDQKVKKASTQCCRGLGLFHRSLDGSTTPIMEIEGKFKPNRSQ